MDGYIPKNYCYYIGILVSFQQKYKGNGVEIFLYRMCQVIFKRWYMHCAHNGVKIFKQVFYGMLCHATRFTINVFKAKVR